MKFLRKRKIRSGSGRGTIALIATLLVTSAMVRLASGSGEAFAQGVEKPQAETKSPTESPFGKTALAGADHEVMNNLLVALQEREAKVKERETQLAVRSKALSVVDEEVAKRLVALENAEAELRATLALADGAAENDLARLTSVYENMKPKDAAALFEAMEPDFAAGFLGRMRPDAAAPILAGLTPEAAYSISVILASRNANVPKS